LTPILWHKIANGATEVEGNGAGFYGKPYQPGGIIKNDIEYILFLRKAVNTVPRLCCKKRCLCSRVKKCRAGNVPSGPICEAPPHATVILPVPRRAAERLIRLFSFAGTQSSILSLHWLYTLGCYDFRKKFNFE